jgi:hypothetical protein
MVRDEHRRENLVAAERLQIADVKFSDESWAHIEGKRREITQAQIREVCLGKHVVLAAYPNPRTGAARHRVVGPCSGNLRWSSLTVVVEVVETEETKAPGIYLAVTAWPAHRDERRAYESLIRGES